MPLPSFSALKATVRQARAFFTTRDVILHDGRDLRRFSIGGRAQAMAAGVGAVTLMFSAYGVAQAAVGAIQATGVAGEPQSAEGRMLRMRAQMLAMQADVAAVKVATRIQAARIAQRQALLAAVISGKGDPDKLALDVPASAIRTRSAAQAVAPLVKLERQQVALAAQAHRATVERIAATEAQLRRLGVAPQRLVPGGMGGPYEPVDADAPAPATPEAALDAAADQQFRNLFAAWKKLDSLEEAAIAIPSIQPVDSLSFTSNFGVRADPFRGTAAMHSGVDIPGPVGTPIYATADGIVQRAERSGGYGNMVEVNHGKGIETRYGHLSRILVAPNTRVTRGQLIGLMGSTGRSTGSHLHYEVRVDGRAINPAPFMQSGEAMLAIQDRQRGEPVAVGGPSGK